MAGKSITLTYFTVAAAGTYPGRNYIAREHAERAVAGGYTTGPVEEVNTEYTVGQAVEVDAFGRWRPGKVTAVGRTKVKVQYARNLNGTLAERSFGAIEVRPAGSGRAGMHP